MASFFIQTLFILSSLFFSTIFITTTGEFSKHSPIIVQRMEKRTDLHFYFHDVVDGKNPTAMRIVTPPSEAVGGFGATFMADDPLTEGPEPTSKLVGRAQGVYALASQHEIGLLMVMTFAFVEGTSNGSTLSILGRNLIFDTVREMPVVGGTGLFRYAQGYALAKTVRLTETGNAVVEYNISVIHNGDSEIQPPI
ncbi:dirigent protein 22-like isoform X1 [Tripterygium wilfordii]|uniref:Dirigent protein n=1 Tax=Tripterygium wilfordii TaxID=458696 RepID=A0A7J7C561_TRIWF|nr:dirigent protein 19-like [Tripterygium wilfordii]KAF5729300.1 dirigent protein 22-like isoform X1 [Tripterygium wilfordii]